MVHASYVFCPKFQLNKDDTDDILLANKIIRETHQDLCESAEECLEKTEKSLGKIRDESLKDGVNTSLFLLAIEQIEAAFNNIMVANATLCINKDKALCNELLNKASKEGKVLFRRVEANGDVKYEKHPEDKINEKENDGFEVLCSCNGLYPSGDGGGSSGGGGGGGAGGAGPSEFCIPVNGACSNNPSEGRVCYSDPVELFCINTIVQSFKCVSFVLQSRVNFFVFSLNRLRLISQSCVFHYPSSCQRMILMPF
jgi:hypothetical protein